MDEPEKARKKYAAKGNRVTWLEKKKAAYEKELLNWGKEIILSNHHTVCFKLRRSMLIIS